jgi:hypothetical protein
MADYRRSVKYWIKEGCEMKKTVLTGMLLMFILSLPGCAFDLAHVRYKPTEYIPSPDVRKSFVIGKSINITDGTCYDRTLMEGIRWNLVGRTREGEIYKSSEQILTLECSNVHEAYLVVSNDGIVGFYLPVEKGFVGLPKPIKMNIRN